ncbi:MAG: hypothetical protein JNM13_12170 [Hyphomicrobiaceae bacterium]|nr:hypothetical protein [Hyphomicrobiaceae bacterium]
MSITAAILLVAHGDRGETARNGPIAAMCARLGRRWPEARVGFGVMNGEPSLGCGLAGLDVKAGEWLIVVPLFMADGFFTRVKLPRDLAAQGAGMAEILAAAGLDPGVGDLIEARLREALGAPRADGSILICAHGSRSGVPDSRLAAEAMAGRLRAAGWGEVACAYVEEAPFITDGLDADRRDAVIGLFASLGTHAINDVAAEVAGHPHVRLFIPAIGAEPEMAEVVAAMVERRVERPSAEERRAAIVALRRKARPLPGPDAAHSQDFLYGDDGLPI